MKKMKKIFFMYILMLLIVGTTGCFGDNDTNVASGSKINSTEKSWQTISIPQDNEGKFYVDLPFSLNEHGEFKSDKYTNNNYWYRYESKRIFVSLDHIAVMDKYTKINFDVKTFSADFKDSDRMNLKLEKTEEKEVDGKKATYAKIKIIDDEPYIIEGLGVQSGSEYWTIVYSYKEGDKEMEDIVKKSIKTIAIR